MADRLQALQVRPSSHPTPNISYPMQTDTSKALAERIVLDPRYHAPLTLVKAVRNGLVYGTKIRFPHAMVMVFLFRSGTYV